MLCLLKRLTTMKSERQLSFERIKTKKLKNKSINLLSIIKNFITNHRFHFRLKIL